VRLAGWRRAPLAERRKHLRGYPWSSYASLIGVRACPRWVDRDAVLGHWGRSRASQARAYARFVEEGLVRELANPLAASAAQAVLGSESFLEWVRARFVRVGTSARVRREQGQAPALASWVSLEDLLARVADAFDTEPSELVRRWSRNNTGRQVLL